MNNYKYLKPALDLQLPGGKTDRCSPICLSVHPSGLPSFLSITNHILSIILHRRRIVVVVVVVLLFYVHGKHLRSCRDGQLT